MFSFFKKRKLQREIDRLSRRGVFYFKTGDVFVKCDPLYTYMRLKEVGLDVMYEDLEGALRGNERKLHELTNNIRDAFNVEMYNVTTGQGMTALDLIRMYLAFYRYLNYLKKNVPLLHDFVPGLEERLESISNAPGGTVDFDGMKSSSDSISTPPKPSPLPDLQTTTAESEHLTD